jgi:hypothetical protein
MSLARIPPALFTIKSLLMQSTHLLKAGMLALVLTVGAAGGREWYLRSQGTLLSYEDGPPLWASRRAAVYQPSDKAVVFIGSSRIKYALDIPTWRQLTGMDAVQLAVEGSSPLPVLNELAADPAFKGKLLVDVTEPLFFSGAGPNLEWTTKNIDYYQKQTPSQKVSDAISRTLESKLVLLEKDYFSLTASLNGLHLPNRPGVFRFPDFPPGFGVIDLDRQNRMSEAFLADSNQRRQVMNNWIFFQKMSKEGPPTGARLDSILQSVKRQVDRIKARGGEVVFVRTPSSGAMLQGEKMGFPREDYWDRLLATTRCAGIHFEDYGPIASFECPELSHLKPSDAVVFTRHLVPLLQSKGWRLGKADILH